MDYKEQQQEEIEILQSIYPDELFVESETEFYINLLLETSSERRHRLKLLVKYPETYPDVAPELDVEIGELLEIDNVDSDEEVYEGHEEVDDDGIVHKVVLISEKIEIEDEDLQSLKNLLIEEAEEQIGIPSVFALASSLKDHGEQLFEDKVNKEQKKYDEELLIKEREEQKKFYGTKVTVESYNEWRLKFRKELKIDERLEERKKKYHNGKLTGKEIFERGLAGDDDVIEELGTGIEKLTTTE